MLAIWRIHSIPSLSKATIIDVYNIERVVRYSIIRLMVRLVLSSNHQRMFVVAFKDGCMWWQSSVLYCWFFLWLRSASFCIETFEACQCFFQSFVLNKNAPVVISIIRILTRRWQSKGKTMSSFVVASCLSWWCYNVHVDGGWRCQLTLSTSHYRTKRRSRRTPSNQHWRRLFLSEDISDHVIHHYHHWLFVPGEKQQPDCQDSSWFCAVCSEREPIDSTCWARLLGLGPFCHHTIMYFSPSSDQRFECQFDILAC